MLASAPILLKKNSLYVWQVVWEEYIDYKAYFWRILSLEEKNRAAKRLRAINTHQFIVTRGLLRVAIGYLLGQAPHAVKFIYTMGQKPEIVNTKGLAFNISHTSNKALYAFSLHTQIGIDIEDMSRKLGIERLAIRYFSTQENIQLASFPDLLKRKAFFKGWTQKEAITKAYGLGLQMPFHQIEVNIKHGSPRLVKMHNPALKHLQFLLYPIEVAKDYYAVIAAQTKQKKLDVFCMDSIFHLSLIKIISSSSGV